MILRFFPDSRLVAAVHRAYELWVWHTTTLVERVAFRNGPQPPWDFGDGQDEGEGPPPPPGRPDAWGDDYPYF